MRKIITLCVVGLTIATSFGQELEQSRSLSQNDLKAENIDPRKEDKNYNRWSVNLNGGFNMPGNSFTKGYNTVNNNFINDPVPNHFDLNVRRMFNTKFGLMLDFGYDKFSNEGNKSPFRNNMYSTSVQGVLNIHRALNWEEFTNTFGLQLHFGPSLAFLENNVSKTSTNNQVNKNGKTSIDIMYNVVSGATLLIKASDKLAFNVDYSLMKSFSQDINFDGRGNVDLINNRTGLVHTATIGLTLYLGGKDKHADWYWEKKADKSAELLTRIDALEAKLKDNNNNNFPDGMEQYVDSRLATGNSTAGDQNYSNSEMRDMINSNYINVFFDFDKSTISTGTISAVNFLIKYLNNNPDANAEVIGYADELGNFDYNMRLSERRAKNVTEMIVKSGISASRLKVVVKGEDNSVPKESTLARQLVRRVVFKVN